MCGCRTDDTSIDCLRPDQSYLRNFVELVYNIKVMSIRHVIQCDSDLYAFYVFFLFFCFSLAFRLTPSMGYQREFVGPVAKRPSKIRCDIVV